MKKVGNPRTSGSCGGFEPRARCAGFSVVQIGNRKERLRDYASFPDWGSDPTSTPIVLYFFSFGSSASRRPSPMKFRENIVRLMAAMGKNI